MAAVWHDMKMLMMVSRLSSSGWSTRVLKLIGLKCGVLCVFKLIGLQCVGACTDNDARIPCANPVPIKVSSHHVASRCKGTSERVGAKNLSELLCFAKYDHTNTGGGGGGLPWDIQQQHSGANGQHMGTGTPLPCQCALRGCTDRFVSGLENPGMTEKTLHMQKSSL